MLSTAQVMSIASRSGMPSNRGGRPAMSAWPHDGSDTRVNDCSPLASTFGNSSMSKTNLCSVRGCVLSTEKFSTAIFQFAGMIHR